MVSTEELTTPHATFLRVSSRKASPHPGGSLKTWTTPRPAPSWPSAFSTSGFTMSVQLAHQLLPVLKAEEARHEAFRREGLEWHEHH